MEPYLLDHLYITDGIDAFIFQTLICWTDHYPAITGVDRSISYPVLDVEVTL